MRLVICLLGIFFTPLLHAYEIKHINTDVVDKRYEITLKAILNAPQAKVYQALSDYDNFHLLNDSFTSSRLVRSLGQEYKLTELVTDNCVLFYCVKAILMEVVKKVPNKLLIVTIRPEESDFHFGRTVWKLSSPTPQQTHIDFTSIKAPKFWVPPMIGNVIVKNKLQKETIETLEGVEKIAKQ